MPKLPALLLLVVLLVGSRSFTQHSRDYTLTHYNVGNGLATNKVHHVTQDSLNRLWFATGYGVSIYDGLVWENIPLLTPQNTAGYRKTLIDDRGNIWLIPLAANHAIKLYKNGKWSDLAVTPGIPPEVECTNDAAVARINGKTVLAIGTDKHIYLMIDNEWITIKTAPGACNSFAPSQSKLYFAGSEGLAALTLMPDGKPKITKGTGGITTPILAVAQTPRKTGHLLILAVDWIGETDTRTLTKFPATVLVDFKSQVDHYYIAEDNNGRIYFGNKIVKNRYDRETATTIPIKKEQGYTSDGATTVFVDRENNVWISDLRGIDKITYHPFKNFYKSDGLLEDEVTTILEYTPGNYIFGHNSGYTVYSGGKFRTVSFHQTKEENYRASRVLEMISDPRGNIWAACGIYGLIKIDPQGSYTTVIKRFNSVTSVLYHDKLGLLVTTTDDIFTLEGNQLVPLNKNLKSQNYRKMVKTGGEFYIASAEGLFRIEDRNVTNLIPKADPISRNTYAVLKEPDNSLLVGSEAGLFSYANNRYTRFSKNGFSLNKSVYFIIKTKQNHYWFGTADGLVYWDSNANTSEFIVQDGLAGYEMNRSAALIDTKNTFWIGTNTGLSAYRIGTKPASMRPPLVWLAKLETTEGKSYDLKKENTIPYNANTLIFSIRGISYISEELIRYRVKLEGFDKDFYEITQSQLQNVRYLNLPSGSYRLVVMAKNRFSEWSRPAYSKVILIEKPLFLQTWFILLILTVVVTAVLFGNKYFLTTREHTRLEEMVEQRTKDLAKSQKELKATLDGLEEQVRQRTEELENSNRTKDKIFSIISHDLRSPFMSILGYSELLHDDISSIDPATVEKYTGRIIEASQNTLTMIDGLLDWSKLQMGGIVPTNETIRLQPVILEIEDLFRPQVAAKNLSLITEVDPQIHITSDPAILRTVIRNLLSNAIKFTNSGGLIKISSTQYDEMVSIQISDTGIGIPEDIIPTLFTFDTVQSRKGTANEKGTGLGLSLVHDLLEKVDGQISLQSTVGTGSVFTISLPAGMSPSIRPEL